MQIFSTPDNDSAPNPAGSVFNNLPKMFLKIKKKKKESNKNQDNR